MEYTSVQAERMDVECASCGQLIPSGQFRCGGCGAVQTRESFDDYGGLSEVSADRDGAARAASAEATAPARTAPPSDEEEAGTREPLVPRGTFASEQPERGGEDGERESARSEPVPKAPKPHQPGAAVGNSQRLKTVRNAPRPPYLASEILREDLTPSEPGRRLLPPLKAMDR
jgi:hypothetical protein